ncbi:glycosyltransferase [bacterium]|nr:glycosyltransferase [candidate division CSSED10-310 bacterium]
MKNSQSIGPENVTVSRLTADERIRVVRVISGLWPGGVEKKLLAVLPRLDKTRFAVSVVCLRETGELADELRDQGIPVALCHVRNRWSPSGIVQLRSHFRAQGADIVHTHMYRSNITGAVAARLAGTPVVIANIHNVASWDDVRQVYTDRWVSRLRDCTIFVSQAVADDYLSRIPIPENARAIIYNGVDTHWFSPDSSVSRFTDGEVAVGAAARLVPQKALDFVVRAAADPQFQKMKVHFYVAGDGPLRESMMAQAQAMGAASNFHLLGFQDDIREFYRRLDVFVMPSRKEGFSNALLEAMACGVSSVATRVGGNGEAIRDGRDGRLIEPGDYAAFRAALLDLVRNPDNRRRMSEEARQRAEMFSIEGMVHQTESLYLTLVKKKVKYSV